MKQIDEKIEKIETELKAKNPKAKADWDPVYGQKIEEPVVGNYDYDMNLKRGFMARKTISKFTGDVRSQDEHIRRRINKLFFLRKLEYLKKKTLFNFDTSELPISLRNKEKMINELAHRYK